MLNCYLKKKMYYPMKTCLTVMDYGQRNFHFLSPEVPPLALYIYPSEVYLHN